MKINKILMLFLLALCFFSFNKNVLAATNVVHIKLFYGDGCPHCANEEKFLDEMLDRYDNLDIEYYEVWHNEENKKLMEETAKKYGDTVKGVPYTIIEDETFMGYGSSSSILMEQAIIDAQKNNDISENKLNNNNLMQLINKFVIYFVKLIFRV